jgi:RNA polymerase sigma-70 factor (ECF subfamily)
MVMHSDEDLARRTKDGDGAAFAALLERHYDRVYRLGFRLLGSRAEAEDLAQDVCAALPGKIGGYRGEARFTTWLYRVTVNAAEDRRRRSARQTRLAADWGTHEIDRQAGLAEDAEARTWLAEAMRSLPDELVTTLALLLDEGMTHAEAGQVLGVSEGTIHWRMAEVRKRLRALHAKELEA